MAKKEELKAENEEKTKAESLEEEAKRLGVTKTKVSISGYNIKDKTTEKIAKEEKKHQELADKRLKGRVAQAKLDAKKKPIDKRKTLLVSRFKAVRSRVRPHTYSNANIEAWTEEYNLIVNNPKRWNLITKNGKIPFAPGNKRKRTAKEILDGMDLGDENESS